jgi:hypothetical protein
MSHADYLAFLSKSVERNVSGDGLDSEADLHRQIQHYCQQQGWLVFHGSMAHRSHRTVGEPDFTILANEGRVVMCECKRRGGKLSLQQAATIHWANKLGHTIHVVTSMPEFVAITKTTT